MKHLLGIALGLLLLLAPVAKADGFNPMDVYPPNQIAFDYTYQIPTGGQVRWVVEAFDASPAGASFYGYCTGPFNPVTNDTYPWCSTDGFPIGPVFEPAGALFGDIATVIFGFDPGLNPPSVPTPEPSTGGLLVAGCFLCSLVALRLRMA